MKRARILFPLAMTILGGFLLCGLAAWRMSREPDSWKLLLCLAAILLYGGWKIWEFRISVDEVLRSESHHDLCTVEICAVVEIALLVSLFWSGTRPPFGPGIGGVALMAVGIHIRVIAIRALGKGYSLRIRPLSKEPVCIGPYGRVRHPAYLGTILCHAGIVMVFANRVSFLILAVWVAVVLVRTLVEDRFLMGDAAYRRYAQRVRRRLMPGIPRRGQP